MGEENAAPSGLTLTPQPLSPRLPPDLTGERGSNLLQLTSPSSPGWMGGRPGEERRGDEGQPAGYANVALNVQPPRHVQGMPGDVPRLLAGEEEDGGGDVVHG